MRYIEPKIRMTGGVDGMYCLILSLESFTGFDRVRVTIGLL